MFELRIAQTAIKAQIADAQVPSKQFVDRGPRKRTLDGCHQSRSQPLAPVARMNHEPADVAAIFCNFGPNGTNDFMT